MLPALFIRYWAWLHTPRADGKAGLIVLAAMICRLKIARYLLRIAMAQANFGQWLIERESPNPTIPARIISLLVRMLGTRRND